MTEVVTLHGVNGQVVFDGQSVKILRKGFMAKATQGLKGDKTLPIRMISSIQFKRAGILANGYIQFATGAGESRAGLYDAVKDENSVMFMMGSNDAFEELKNLIESAMSSGSFSGGPASNPADTIRQLKGLLDDGLITKSEYEAKKAKLLKEI